LALDSCSIPLARPRWLHMCDMTRSCVCDMTRSCVCHVSRVHTCDTTRSCVCVMSGLFTRVVSLVRVCVMTHPHVSHHSISRPCPDGCICVTCLNYICNEESFTTHSHVCSDSLHDTHVCHRRVSHMCVMTRSLNFQQVAIST